MFSRSARLLTSACMLLLALASRADASPTTDLVDEFTSTAPALGLSTRSERSASVSSRFDELGLRILVDNAADLGREDLGAVFDAAQHAMFYTLDPYFLASMESTLSLLEKSGDASEQNRRSMYQAYVSVRQFDAATRLSTTHPSTLMPPLPEIRDPLGADFRGPSAWAVSDDGKSLTRRSLQLGDLGIVVVAHPGCGYTRKAVASISADAELARIFENAVHWLAPQDGNISAPTFVEWNKATPAAQIAIVHRMDELPLIDSWATPTFYFVSSGRVVAKVVGWPNEGRKAELIAAAEAIGLIDSSK